MKKISAIAIAILLMISASARAEETPAKKQDNQSHHCALNAKDSADQEGCCCCCAAHNAEKSAERGSCPIDHAKAGCCSHHSEKAEKAENPKPTN